MSDRYRERWERRQAKWERRRAKWEARRARHEARRARRAAKRAAWEARRAGQDAGGGHAGGQRFSRIALALLGSLFIMFGLYAARWIPGIGNVSVGGFFVCLAPGFALLLPLLLGARSRSEMPAAEVRQVGAGAQQGAPQAAATEDQGLTPAAEASPQAAQPAPSAGRQVPEQPQPRPAESYPDSSYYRERAAAYRRRIQSIIRGRRPGPLADMMATVVGNLQQWEERVDQLADRLTTFERDTIIQRDIAEVPANIIRLRDRIAVEPDAGFQAQMARTLAGYESQQAMLDTLVRLMRRTRLLLDDTLVAMGTVYSQVRVIDAIDIDSAQTLRIAEELDEQVKRLNDLLAVLGDAYRGTVQPDESADSARRIRLERGSVAGS
jgi:hypothetical protein